MSAEQPLGQRKRHRLAARFARFLFWPPADSASRACGSIRCTTARLSFAAPLTVGSVRSRRTSPLFWGVTVFSRYADAWDFALSVTRRYVCVLCRVRPSQRIGSASRSIMQVYQATGIRSRAGVSRSALLLLRFLSLTAGT
jgi:hypothetical protein